MRDFVHIHVHSHFTLLEPTRTIPQLVKTVKEPGQLTDRVNLFGPFEFASAAKDAGHQADHRLPVYVAPLGLRKRRATRISPRL